MVAVESQLPVRRQPAGDDVGDVILLAVLALVRDLTEDASEAKLIVFAERLAAEKQDGMGVPRVAQRGLDRGAELLPEVEAQNLDARDGREWAKRQLTHV